MRARSGPAAGTGYVVSQSPEGRRPITSATKAEAQAESSDTQQRMTLDPNVYASLLIFHLAVSFHSGHRILFDIAIIRSSNIYGNEAVLFSAHPRSRLFFFNNLRLKGHPDQTGCSSILENTFWVVLTLSN